MESVRQMLGAMYIALGTAAGEEVLDRANKILTDTIDTGAVDDLYARSALLSLVKSCKTKTRIPA
jgi:hypothetical protein